MVTVWVDNLLIFATSIELRDKARSDIECEWEVTDLGKPTKIISIEITRTSDSITISSSRYIELILQKEGLNAANAVATPLDPNVPLEPNPEGYLGSRSNLFARLLGVLQYISNATSV